MTLSKDEVEKIQIALNKKGYKLDVDGYWGTKTDEAYKDYKSKPVPEKINLISLIPVLYNLSQGKINMNMDQVKSGLRWAVTVIGTLLAAKGIGDAAGWEIVASSVVAIAPVVWSWFVHK